MIVLHCVVPAAAPVRSRPRHHCHRIRCAGFTAARVCALPSPALCVDSTAGTM